MNEDLKRRAKLLSPEAYEVFRITTKTIMSIDIDHGYTQLDIIEGLQLALDITIDAYESKGNENLN